MIVNRHLGSIGELHQQFIDIYFIRQKTIKETAVLLDVSPKVIRQFKKELDSIWRPITEIRNKWKSKKIGGNFWDFYDWINTTEKCCHYCKITQEELNQLNSIGLINKRKTRGRTLEIDRKKPDEKYDNFSNLTYSCYWCNNAKTDTFTEQEFMIIGEAISNVWKLRLENLNQVEKKATIKIIIDKPANISTDLFNELLKVIETGAQVELGGLTERIKNADLIAIAVDGERIVSTATLKNPAESYRDKVFRNAKVEVMKDKFVKELGYIVTIQGYEGKKICQTLLKEILPFFADYNVFATTRKPEMMHILRKFGFNKAGAIYNNDLQLLIYES